MVLQNVHQIIHIEVHMKFINTKLVDKNLNISVDHLNLSYCMESIEYQAHKMEINKYFLDVFGTDTFDLNGNMVEEYQPRDFLTFKEIIDKNFIALAVAVPFEQDYLNWIEISGFNPIQKNYSNELVLLGYELISSFGMYSATLDNVENILLKANKYGLLSENTAYKFKLELERLIPEHKPWMIIALFVNKAIKYELDSYFNGKNNLIK